MDIPAFEFIAFERSDRRLDLVLNRPEKMNAFNRKMEQEFGAAMAFAASDPGSDVVVLTGAGRAFSAGADFSYIDELREDPVTFDIALAKRAVTSILDCEKPVIAKINGDAVGLGATLALFCDMSYMGSAGKIGDPHVKLGYVAGDGGTVIWPQLVGYARAKEHLFTGQLLDALSASQMGLVNYCIEEEALDKAVSDCVMRLLRMPQLALRWTKRAVNISLRQQVESVLESSLAYEAMSIRTADHNEAVNALKERRKPVFTGR